MHVHHLKGYIQDMYLIEYPDKLLLLDAGCRCDVPMLLSFITDKLGRKLQDLKVLVVTHVHPDHAGGIAQIRSKTGCHVVTGKNNNHWYTGVAGMSNFVVDLMLTHMVAKKMKRPFRFIAYNPYFKADSYLVENDTLPYFPDWTVLLTNGHTDRDLTLYHKEESIAYVADLIIKTKRSYICPYPIYLPIEYKSALTRVKNLEVKRFLLAHGGEAKITADDIDIVIKKAPNKPLTNYLSLKRAVQKNFK